MPPDQPTIDQEKTERVVRPFADFLTMQDGGRLHAEAGSSLAELIAAVRATGKAGTLALTIKVEPMKGNERMVTVAGSTAVKLPKGQAPTSAYFVAEDGTLSRNDPAQQMLPLREVGDLRDTRAVGS